MDETLCDLARLAWAMHEAERAADAELDAASLALLGSEDPARLGLRMRPGLQLLPQSGGPVLVWRKGWRACSAALAPADAALMQALLAGRDLAFSLDAAALAGGPEFDFPGLAADRLARSLAAGRADPN